MMQLEKLLTCITSDETIDMQAVLEFRARIRSLCDRAPEAARYFAFIILEFTDTSASSIMRRSKARDPTYRPPKSPRIVAQAGSEENEDQITPCKTPSPSPPPRASPESVPASLVGPVESAS
ncbi:hypothetical protein V8E54_007953 [Elaphomyces granulatus]